MSERDQQQDPAEETPASEGTGDDEGRLQTLNQLYQELEAELDRDVDETGSAGR